MDADGAKEGKVEEQKIRAKKPPPFHSKKQQQKQDAILTYSFPQERSAHIDLQKHDYSKTEVFRSLLGSWHCHDFLTYPSFALEICSLFLRCINAGIIRQQHMQHEFRQDFITLVSAVSWMYAFGYKDADEYLGLKGYSLNALYQQDRVSFDVAAEMVQLLITCSWHSLAIRREEVFGVVIGENLVGMIHRAKLGVEGKSHRTIGLYLPLYIVLRALHPACPNIDQIPKSNVEIQEQISICNSEPKLYSGIPGEVNLFPIASEDGANYNLWFFYDSLQPLPNVSGYYFPSP